VTEIKAGQVREARQSEKARATGVVPDSITIVSVGERWALARRGNGPQRNWTVKAILKRFPAVRGEP
jgi:hypothetical protein